MMKYLPLYSCLGHILCHKIPIVLTKRMKYYLLSKIAKR